jgi:hypothetical protein
MRNQQIFDVVVLILKYEKILASHSHGKKCTKYAYQSSQVPMFVQNQPQISPNVSSLDSLAP